MPLCRTGTDVEESSKLDWEMHQYSDSDYNMTTDSEQESQQHSEPEPGLKFPWGRLSIVETWQSSRAEAFLKYVQNQPSLRRLHLLDRLLGVTKHRTKASYRYHNALRQYYRAKHKLENTKWI